ncbi:MAG: MFS transporter [Chloroflexi bacterium]|nr:MFS transporter [Chloroflexota bacterium]MCL5951713.1 MFS transporter [Chloroflexota bacterium]
MSSTSSTATVPSAAPLAALQYRDFRLIWLGQLVSTAGTQMQLVAINWHIYILTGSALALGLTGLARVVPLVAFSLVGGVFADAHDRRRLMIFTQSSMLVFAAALGLLTNVGWASVGVIYLLSALTAAATAFDTPVRKALPPNLVPKEHLANAMSLTNLMQQAGSIVGPALAGFVIAWKGVAAVYWINAASFLAVILALLLIKLPTQENLGAVRLSLSSLWEGIRFVRRSEILYSTMVLDFFATFFSSATALLPIFARDILHVGPEGMGMLYSAESIGAVGSGVGLSLRSHLKKQGALLLGAVAVYGAATALYGISQQFALSFVLLMIVGAGDTVSTILRNTIRQIWTPDQMRGRMSGVNAIFISGGPQLGDLEAGLLAAAVGAPISVVVGGVATVVIVALMAWKVPFLRNYQDENA